MLAVCPELKMDVAETWSEDLEGTEHSNEPWNRTLLEI
jgi:hypothetical protein